MGKARPGLDDGGAGDALGWELAERNERLPAGCVVRRTYDSQLQPGPLLTSGSLYGVYPHTSTHRAVRLCWSLMTA